MFKFKRNPEVFFQPHTIPKIFRNPLLLILRGIETLLATLGLLVVAFLIFIYLQGQKAATPFDDRFIATFSEFIKQSLQKDIATATTIKIPLENGVTIEQAVQAMKIYAQQVNIKLIGDYTLHEENPSKKNLIKVFEFFDPDMMVLIANYNPHILPTFPLRITLYQEEHGKVWLFTHHLDLLIHGSRHLDPIIKHQMIKFQDALLKIMGAGASGLM